jgi:hypothetical protein
LRRDEARFLELSTALPRFVPQGARLAVKNITSTAVGQDKKALAHLLFGPHRVSPDTEVGSRAL